MIIFVDIDHTICYYDDTHSSIPDYNKALPYDDRIARINELYDKGNEIVYWTARGTKTGQKWFHVTLQQLQQWGCKFHELRMGKPAYDLFMDDKNINSDAFFNI